MWCWSLGCVQLILSHKCHFCISTIDLLIKLFVTDPTFSLLSHSDAKLRIVLSSSLSRLGLTQVWFAVASSDYLCW